MQLYECPKRIYKYLSFNGLCSILESGSIRLSKPTAFNDPFDTNLQDGFANDKKVFFEDLKKGFLDFIESDFDFSSLSADAPSRDKLFFIHQSLKQASLDEKTQSRQQLLDTPVEDLFDLGKMEQVLHETISFIRQSFESDGIFCSSADYRNLLMWAHYTESHKGAVIEFSPSVEKHSFFLASKPVVYSNERPVLYSSAQELIHHTFCMSNKESGRALMDKLVFTKGSDWQYEQEYRLYIPLCMKDGQSYKFLLFHPEELTGIFLGCRMNQPNIEKTIKAAYAFNPSVTVFKATPSPRHYSLAFQRII